MRTIIIYTVLSLLITCICCSNNNSANPAHSVDKPERTGTLLLNCIFPNENIAKKSATGNATTHAYVYCYYPDNLFMGKIELTLIDKTAKAEIQLRADRALFLKVMGFNERFFITYQGKSSLVRIIENQTTEVDIVMKRIGLLTPLPGGSFEMGSDDGEKDEQPVHSVTVDTFQMCPVEVTKIQWASVLPRVNLEEEEEDPEAEFYEESGIYIPPDFPDDDSCPVIKANWFQAVTFCNWLSELSDLDPCYDWDTFECDYSKDGYRLPTEAEWEYACRAGTTTNYYTGASDGDLGQTGWYLINSYSRIHPVAEKEPSPYGLYDMYGNAAEWCNDGYDKNFYGTSSEDNPVAPLGPKREYVIRGGSAFSYSNACRSSARSFARQYSSKSSVGFRVVRRNNP